MFVDSEMYLHVGFLRKGLVTCQTLVRFLTCVCPHVFIKSWATVERFGTFRAWVRPLSCVESTMYGQLYGHGETLITGITVIRPLPRVSPWVHQQGPGATKGHSTCAAQVRFLFHVHPEVHSAWVYNCVNVLSQKVQAYGRSLVWMHTWDFKTACVRTLRTSRHTASPRWWELNLLSQRLHAKDRTLGLEWIRKRWFRSFWLL